MLENEAKFETEKPSAENKKFMLDLFEMVDDCVLRGDAAETIEKFKAAKERETDETAKTFIDLVVELLNEGKDKTKLSARDEATAAANNWSRLRILVAQRGFNIANLSRKTGIASKTLSKHLASGNFKYTQFMSIKAALNIPDSKIDYYLFDEISARQTA